MRLLERVIAVAVMTTAFSGIVLAQLGGAGSGISGSSGAVGGGSQGGTQAAAPGHGGGSLYWIGRHGQHKGGSLYWIRGGGGSTGGAGAAMGSRSNPPIYVL